MAGHVGLRGRASSAAQASGSHAQVRRRAWPAGMLGGALVWALVLAGCASTDRAGPAAENAPPPRDPALLFDGESLAGWKVLKEDFFDAAGKVYVADGRMILEAGHELTGVSYRGGRVPRSNYEVTLEAMRLAGEDFFLGMTFAVGKEYVTLILGGWGGQVVGLSNINFMSAVENETTKVVEFKSDRWYRVRVRVTDERIEAWLDDERIINVDRADKKFDIWPQQEPVRPFGLASYSTKAAYRKIRLRRLDR